MEKASQQYIYDKTKDRLGFILQISEDGWAICEFRTGHPKKVRIPVSQLSNTASALSYPPEHILKEIEISGVYGAGF